MEVVGKLCEQCFSAAFCPGMVVRAGEIFVWLARVAGCVVAPSLILAQPGKDDGFVQAPFASSRWP